MTRKTSPSKAAASEPTPAPATAMTDMASATPIRYRRPTFGFWRSVTILFGFLRLVLSLRAPRFWSLDGWYEIKQSVFRLPVLTCTLSLRHTRLHIVLPGIDFTFNVESFNYHSLATYVMASVLGATAEVGSEFHYPATARFFRQMQRDFRDQKVLAKAEAIRAARRAQARQQAKYVRLLMPITAAQVAKAPTRTRALR